MRIPRSLTIRGKKWEIRFVDEDKMDNCFGFADPENNLIQLSKSLTKDEIPRVFLHELCHAWLHEAGVTKLDHLDSGIDDIVEEIICDNFAELMISLFELRWRKK